MNAVIQINPGIMHGTPCFSGTRVPVESLFQHLKLGYDINEFMRQFPTVQRDQVEAVLDMVSHNLGETAESAA